MHHTGRQDPSYTLENPINRSMVEPAAEYLENLRAKQAPPNTVKSYVRPLAL